MSSKPPQVDAVVMSQDQWGMCTVAVVSADRSSRGDLQMPRAEADWLIGALARARRAAEDGQP